MMGGMGMGMGGNMMGSMGMGGNLMGGMPMGGNMMDGMGMRHDVSFGKHDERRDEKVR